MIAMLYNTVILCDTTIHNNTILYDKVLYYYSTYILCTMYNNMQYDKA